MSPRTRAVTAVLTATAVGGLLFWLRQRRQLLRGVEPRAGAAVTAVGDGVLQPPIPLPADRPGSAEERGSRSSVQLNLARAQEEGVEPVVEFLTYLQEKRGEQSHLLFVRYADLDAIAAREGSDVDQFLSRLDQLGVVVSQN